MARNHGHMPIGSKNVLRDLFMFNLNYGLNLGVFQQTLDPDPFRYPVNYQL